MHNKRHSSTTFTQQINKFTATHTLQRSCDVEMFLLAIFYELRICWSKGTNFSFAASDPCRKRFISGVLAAHLMQTVVIV